MTTDALYREAHSYLLNGKFQQAEKAFQHLLEMDPENALGYQGIAECHYRLGRYNEAITSSQRALEINPNLSIPHLILGSIYVHLERLKDGETELLAAIHKDSHLEGAYRSMGALFFRQQRFSEAETAFRRVIELDPQSSMGYYNLALCHFYQSRYEEALSAVRHALVLKPSLETLDLVLLIYNTRYNSAPLILVFLLYWGLLSIWTPAALPLGLLLVVVCLRMGGLHFQSRDWIRGMIALVGAVFCIIAYLSMLFPRV